MLCASFLCAYMGLRAYSARIALVASVLGSPSFVSISHANPTWSKSTGRCRRFISKKQPVLLISSSSPYRARRGGAIQLSVNLSSSIAPQKSFSHAKIKVIPIEQAVGFCHSPCKSCGRLQPNFFVKKPERLPRHCLKLTLSVSSRQVNR